MIGVSAGGLWLASNIAEAPFSRLLEDFSAWKEAMGHTRVRGTEIQLVKRQHLTRS